MPELCAHSVDRHTVTARNDGLCGLFNVCQRHAGSRHDNVLYYVICIYSIMLEAFEIKIGKSKQAIIVGYDIYIR